MNRSKVLSGQLLWGVLIYVWDVRLERTDLLAGGFEALRVWNDVFRVRESERKSVIGELTAFRSLLTELDARCLLQGVFELIDPEADVIEPCGRCPACRVAE